MDNKEMAKAIAEQVKKLSGDTYFVGGYVRDKYMGIENKDIDIEVHGVTAGELENILDLLGDRIEIGESFGIYGLKGYGIDIAMPRREQAIGRGHRDFDITVDPFIGVYNAAKRRDFTINALMENVLTGELVDCFCGLEDLKNGVIRHVSDETFAEDPLRVLRAAQFAARFGFAVAETTIELCRGIELSTLSKERVEGELKKALLKSDKPSVFFEVLRSAGKLGEWFPEVEQLTDVEQSPIHHPEGDVWNHTMKVVDLAAEYRDRTEYPFGFMLSALTHDFGKIICTEKIDGKIHAYGHEALGTPIVREFLNRITNEARLKKYVVNMCENHMKPNILAENNSSVKSTNRMFDKVTSPTDLIYLSMADKNSNKNADFLFERLKIYDEIMSRPYVKGKDLIEAGLVPYKGFTEILGYAHKLRLAGIEKESALVQTLGYAKTIK